MNITKLFLIFVCCVMVAPTIWGQTAGGPASPGVLGYWDPRTGAFRPVPAGAEEIQDFAALATFGGNVNVTITITLKTTSLTNITCSEEVTVVDAAASGTPRVFNESDTVAATGTGTTRTCKLTIPYSWALTTQASDTMTTSYSVSGSTGTTGLPQRTSTLTPLDSRKAPANGVITALTAAVTL